MKQEASFFKKNFPSSLTLIDYTLEELKKNAFPSFSFCLFQLQEIDGARWDAEAGPPTHLRAWTPLSPAGRAKPGPEAQ